MGIDSDVITVVVCPSGGLVVASGDGSCAGN